MSLYFERPSDAANCIDIVAPRHELSGLGYAGLENGVLRGFELRRGVKPNLVRPWPSILVGLLLALHVAVGSFVSFTPRFTSSIASSAIAPELGSAYSIPARLNQKIPLYELPSDSIGSPRNSGLILLENGRALGPAHALHAEIRQRGGGRYSHWGKSIIFSTSDGSDPRTNGRIYTIKSPTAVNFFLRLVFSAIFLLVDVSLFVMFQKEILAFLRTRSTVLLGALALLAIAAAGLSAFGAFGTLVVASGDLPEDAALSVQALQHAGLGCLLSIGMWAAGAGIIRLVLREPHARLAQVLIPAFPVSLMLLAALVAISLVAPQGRMVALALWVALSAASFELASALARACRRHPRDPDHDPLGNRLWRLAGSALAWAHTNPAGIALGRSHLLCRHDLVARRAALPVYRSRLRRRCRARLFQQPVSRAWGSAALSSRVRSVPVPACQRRGLIHLAERLDAPFLLGGSRSAIDQSFLRDYSGALFRRCCPLPLLGRRKHSGGLCAGVDDRGMVDGGKRPTRCRLDRCRDGRRIGRLDPVKSGDRRGAGSARGRRSLATILAFSRITCGPSRSPSVASSASIASRCFGIFCPCLLQ